MQRKNVTRDTERKCKAMFRRWSKQWSKHSAKREHRAGRRKPQ